MLKHPCPSCGGELTFRSQTSIFAVCPYCRSSIVRHDVDVKSIGEMAELPQDLSPIQVGTTGRYSGSQFYVGGRIIYQWEDGLWNEWYLFFDTGKTGWLSEAQGEFAFSKPFTKLSSDFYDDLELGRKIKLEKDKYELTDIKEVTYLGSEGELPFKAEKGYQGKVYDFSNNDMKFLTIEISNQDSDPLVHIGSYVKLARLKPKNLRVLEGWV